MAHACAAQHFALGGLDLDCCGLTPCCVCVLLQFDESLIASMANEDLVDSLLQELQEEFPQLIKPLLHDR